MSPQERHFPHPAREASSTALPTVALPPAPFGPGARTAITPAASPQHPITLPRGASIDVIRDALLIDGVDRVSGQPHAAFHTAVERRASNDRRHAPRSTGERRTFASQHLAAPTSGPADDPRPLTPPPAPTGPFLVGPLDTRLPQLPSAEVAHVTVAAAEADVRLESIYHVDSNETPIGCLDPWARQHTVAVPNAGPSAANLAPGAGMSPAVATVAASPNAWFGGSVELDDALLVWNSPSAAAPVAPAVIAAIAPGPSGSARVAAPAAATPAFAGAPAAGSTRPAAASSAGASAASLVRLLLLIAIPASAGIGIALALDRFLF